MKSTLMFLLIFLNLLSLKSQNLFPWTNIELVNDQGISTMYYLFTYGNQDLSNTRLKESLHSNNISKIIVSLDSQGQNTLDPSIESDYRIIQEAIINAYNKLFFLEEGFQLSSQAEMIAFDDVELREYEDDENNLIKLYRPTAFTENWFLRGWFNAQIWSSLDPFDEGMKNLDERKRIYKEVFLAMASPVYGNIQQFNKLDNTFENEYGKNLNNAIDATFPYINGWEYLNTVLVNFLNAYINDLAASGASAVQLGKINSFKLKVANTSFSNAVSVLNWSINRYKVVMRAYLLYLYSGEIGLERINLLENLITNNLTPQCFYYDPIISEAIEEARNEYNSRIDNWWNEALNDLISDPFLYTDSFITICTLMSAKIESVLTVPNYVVALPLSALAFSVEMYKYIDGKKNLLKHMTISATMIGMLREFVETNDVNNELKLKQQLLIYDIIRNCAYYFYLNYAERIDGNWFEDLSSNILNWIQGGEWGTIDNYLQYLNNQGNISLVDYQENHAYYWDIYPEINWIESLSKNNLAARFFKSQDNLYIGNNVQFTDNSTGTPTSWQWTFEGGTPATSALQNPTVTYYTAGTFDVTLTVNDGINTSDPLTKPDYITVQNAVTGGLVAYFPFNGNANDESGNGNNGNVDGATPTTDRFGNANSAFNFDGSDDQIVVSPQQILKDFPAANHTYSVWINQSSSPSNVKMVIDCAGEGAGGNQRGIRFHGRPTPIYKWVTNVSSYVTESTIGLTTNNWYHIVGVLEGNTGSIYVNGSLAGTATSSGQPTGITYFKIGNISSGGTGDNFFHGKIDDIMLFNRALSASEISSLYNQSTPCPGTPTVTYEGQIYNTVKIGNQCWMRENLNVGSMTQGTSNQTNNQIIEKYCYNNDPANCSTYGGIYQWDEMMQYSTQEGAKGICPVGWHLPSDQEWCTLTTYLDATVNCSTNGWTGTNAGCKMKEPGTTHWASPNSCATNISGFTALPGGSRNIYGSFNNLTQDTYWWSSTQENVSNSYVWYLHYNNPKTLREYGPTSVGLSARCLKDEYSPIIMISTPNSTTIWQSGYTNLISWTDNISENVKIDLYKNNSFLSNIAYSTFSDGSYDWPIPSGTLAGSDYQIKIASISNSSVYDLSDYFTISTPILTVNSPSGSENWLIGNSYNITWDFTITENVKIRLYKSGDLIKTIKSSTECDGEYSWLVPEDLLPGDDYKIKLSSVSNSNIYDYSSTFTIYENQMTLDLKAYLEGPFNGTDMITNLNNCGLIPLFQPYNIPPWNYSGTESVSEIPNSNVIDWVLVELRDAEDAGSANEGTRISRQAAFILNDGSIVGLNGFSKLTFPTSFIHNLFVIIWHRNHLGLMTALPLGKIDGIYPYDFTGGSDMIYGGINGTKQLAPGKWGMFSGDGDANNTIDLIDKTGIWSPNAGKMGYLNGDFNLDGQVDNKDKNEYWLPNLNRSSQVPE